MSSSLIIALDFDDPKRVLSLVESLDPQTCALKIGSELFTHAGADMVRTLIARGFRIFLDLKFHDIPNTVAKACHAAADLGVWMVTVHACGGQTMLEAARDAMSHYGKSRPKVIAVTVLTSMAESDLRTVGVAGSLADQVTRLALLAKQTGMDGVVCSAWEVPLIKGLCGPEFWTITPGIRLPGDALDDQTRIMTPQAAKDAGSDFLVVGRSITGASMPAEVVSSIVRDLR